MIKASGVCHTCTMVLRTPILRCARESQMGGGAPRWQERTKSESEIQRVIGNRDFEKSTTIQTFNS